MSIYNDCSLIQFIEYKKNGEIEQTPCNLRKKKFNYIEKPTLERTFIVDGIEISWYYVYESFKSKEEQKININHKNVNYRSREDLEHDLAIHVKE